MIARNQDPDDERERMRSLMARKRAGDRDLTIPPCASIARREALEANDQEWLRYYFAHRFFNPFTEAHLEIISDFDQLVTHGGDKAIADQRGGGKTTIVKGLTTKFVFTGRLRFPVIFGANGLEARSILDDIKNEIEGNDQLCEDYPEVCVPIRALDRWAARARKQTVGGVPTNIKWSEDKIVFPTVEGSRASGACIQIRGMDAAVRGLNERGMRPDFALFDDAETTESAESDGEIEKRERRIERDVAFLGGQNRRIARLMLCTLSNRKCLAFKYTDPKIKPSFGGRRYRQLVKMPDKPELWDDYMHKLRSGQELGTDPEGNVSRQLYLDNREAMDAGAIIGNPYRYDAQRGEVSALQACYNFIARTSWESFCTEMQNDPPEVDGPQTSGLNASIVESRTNGLQQREVHRDATKVVVSIDLGDFACHWQAKAWMPGGIGMTIDHGIVEVHGVDKKEANRGANKTALTKAIYNALCSWRESLLKMPFVDTLGQTRPIDLALIDSGDGEHTDAVYQFCREFGAPFVPIKGKTPYTSPKASGTIKVGNHWHKSYQPADKVWLCILDTDYWKRFSHDRWLTPTFDENQRFRIGGMSLWSPYEKRDHHSFARHIVAEELRREWQEGKPEKVYWYQTNRNNHWLDTDYVNCAGSNMLGISLVAKPGPKPRRSLGEMAKSA